MRPIDAILDAAQHRVETSGILDSTARMGIVAAVADDGTITVTVADSTIPRVRLLRSAQPSVGASVELLRTVGGWVCIGELANSSPGWATPSLSSPWAPFGGIWQAPRYRRVGGQVEIQGVVSATGNHAADATIFTLPVGFRPAASLAFAQASTGPTFRQTAVSAAGVVYIRAAANAIASGQYLSINCQFSAE